MHVGLSMRILRHHILQGHASMIPIPTGERDGDRESERAQAQKHRKTIKQSDFSNFEPDNKTSHQQHAKVGISDGTSAHWHYQYGAESDLSLCFKASPITKGLVKLPPRGKQQRTCCVIYSFIATALREKKCLHLQPILNCSRKLQLRANPYD